MKRVKRVNYVAQVWNQLMPADLTDGTAKKKHGCIGTGVVDTERVQFNYILYYSTPPLRPEGNSLMCRLCKLWTRYNTVSSRRQTSRTRICGTTGRTMSTMSTIPHVWLRTPEDISLYTSKSVQCILCTRAFTACWWSPESDGIIQYHEIFWILFLCQYVLCRVLVRR